jgi:DNA-repair protein XRCC2
MTRLLQVSPPGCTQIPALDAHLSARHSFTMTSFDRGDVIEIQGPASSGKTHLLYHIVITCVMPSSYHTADLRGWQKAALVFDTDGTFSIRRLRDLLLSRLTRMLLLDGNTLSGPSAVDELVDQALKRIHIFRPNSSNQLAATLAQLPAYHARYLIDSELCLLAIDSMSSFYWPDRYTVEQFRSARVPVDSEVIDAAIVTPNPLQHVLTILQRLRVSHGLVTIFTNWGLNPLAKPPSSDSSASMAFYRQHLHPSLSYDDIPQQIKMHAPTSKVDTSVTTPMLTHHITLPFIAIPPFHPGLSIEAAELEEEKYRNEVVRKGEVTGIVRTAGSTPLGRFVFRISDKEVEVSL